MGKTKPDKAKALAAVRAYLGRVASIQRTCRDEERKVTEEERADVARLRNEWACAFHGKPKGTVMTTATKQTRAYRVI